MVISCVCCSPACLFVPTVHILCDSDNSAWTCLCLVYLHAWLDVGDCKSRVTDQHFRPMSTDALCDDADAELVQKSGFLQCHGLPNGTLSILLGARFLSCCVPSCRVASRPASGSAFRSPHLGLCSLGPGPPAPPSCGAFHKTK